MRVLFLLIGLGLSYLSQAQTYTLQEIEALTVQNYPLVKQAALLNQSAQLNIENIKRALYPQLSINGQATYQSDVTSISLPIAGFKPNLLSKDQYRATAEIQQVIYDGGVNKKTQALAQASAKMELIKNEVDIYKLKERVTQIYCTVLYTNEVINQINLIQKDLQNALQKMEALYKNGLVFNNNVLQIKAQLLKNNQKLEEAYSAKRIVLDALELLTNISISNNAKFEIPKNIEINKDNLELSRPELLLFDAQKSTIQNQLELIHAKTNPKLGAFVQTGYGRPGLNMLKNEFDWFSIGGIKLQWSLGGYYTAKKEKSILQNQATMLKNEKDTYTLNNAQFEVPKNIEINKENMELSRPELFLFDAQKSTIQNQLGLIQAKTNPKLGAFVQTGYGRPGLNMLQNEFDWFSIGGVKLQWSLGGYYTAKKEKSMLQNQATMLKNEKDTYTLNNRVQLKQAGDEIEKLAKLIESDKEIIALRDQIKSTSLVQLNNGVITANDYLKEINEYDLANQAMIQHQTQLIQSKLQFQLIKGKN